MTNIEKIRQEIERRKKENMYVDLPMSIGKYYEDRDLLAFIDSLTEESDNHGCGVEFPHFGANYPDAKCIDGYLWDMDSYEDGIYTIGGDDPCPICNTEKWLKDVLDDELFKTRDEALEYVKMLKSKYKHKESLPEEKPSEDLEEAAKEYVKDIPTFKDSCLMKAAFEDGWLCSKGKMLKDAVECEVADLNGEIYNNCIEKGMTDEDKVNIVIVKQDE